MGLSGGPFSGCARTQRVAACYGMSARALKHCQIWAPVMGDPALDGSAEIWDVRWASRRARVCVGSWPVPVGEVGSSRCRDKPPRAPRAVLSDQPQPLAVLAHARAVVDAVRLLDVGLSARVLKTEQAPGTQGQTAVIEVRHANGGQGELRVRLAFLAWLEPSKVPARIWEAASRALAKKATGL